MHVLLSNGCFCGSAVLAWIKYVTVFCGGPSGISWSSQGSPLRGFPNHQGTATEALEWGMAIDNIVASLNT
jgi:hypothetical protein